MNTVPGAQRNLPIFSFASTNRQDRHIETVYINESLSLFLKDSDAV